MQFNSIKSSAGNVTAGVSGVNTLDSIFNTARLTAPDFTTISTRSRQARAQIANAATRADTRVGITGLRQTGANKTKKLDLDAYKKAGNAYMDEYRKAGILGAFQTAATGAMLGIERRANEKDKLLDQQRHDEHMRAIEALMSQERTPPPMYEESPGRPTMPEPTAVPPTLERMPGGQSSTSNSNVTRKVALTQGTFPGIRKAAYEYMTKEKGMSRNHALGLISNGDRESSWILDNPGDGGYSNGIFQWNSGRLTRMKAAVPDWQTNWKGQIDYALSEVGEPGQEYLRTTFATPQAAAEFWTRRWERPLHVDQDVLKNNDFLKSYSF